MYGKFPQQQKMFLDQGWLTGETELQLRFYKNPIHMFKVSVKIVKYSKGGILG